MPLELVDRSASAAAMLHPMRLRILDALREPGSASAVARQLGVPRQKVNYHLRELEKAGFLEEVEQRRAGNCIERIVRAKATHYLIDPQLLGALAADGTSVEDRFSSTYLIALAAGAIRDVAALQQKAAKARKRVPTFALQTDIRFASAEERAEFTNALANAVARLVAKYHDAETPGGRSFRFVIGAYPARTKED
ncbi:MAG: helix-turn-helix transcriptional regulator [Acidobacteria bacterium]|nr:helix-turn-helix transcriptional regulator [Acidobacteriota bacterium]MBV9476753.1 helix-turn-helix transcriptional regulator [Acidobacteriota bacterium]